MNKRVRVLYDGLFAGYLSETDEGYEFSYDQSYLNNPDAMPVSLTMPLQQASFKSNVLFPFFDGLIPEGWLLDIAVEHWKVNPRDRFELLASTCNDTIGAVTIQTE